MTPQRETLAGPHVSLEGIVSGEGGRWWRLGLLERPSFLLLFEGETCEPNPCENGGACLMALSNEAYTCECRPGFTGPNCASNMEVAADGEDSTSGGIFLGPCHPNPCHNGGMCEVSETYRGDTFIGYVCKCAPGFNGIHCQHTSSWNYSELTAFHDLPQDKLKPSAKEKRNVNECERDPCKNGGICTDLVANYSCECPGEYMGRNCQYKCSGPLGMEGGIISNQQITASSTHRALFGLQKWYPYFARLNKKGLVNAWTAAENDRWPWIQINLQRRMRVTGLITQGAKRIGSPEYVKSYKVASSDDGKTWRTYKVKGTDEDMVFRGNVDNNTPSANSFTPPIEAQYVRIYPQVCRRHCTLRMELLGCELTGCSEPLGMKSGHIQDYQITASSIFRTLNMDMFTWEPGKARLDKQGKVNAWTAGHSDQSQWLQIYIFQKAQVKCAICTHIIHQLRLCRVWCLTAVSQNMYLKAGPFRDFPGLSARLLQGVDMLVPTKITGVITQGAKDFGHVQFVGSYKVAYSNDGERWHIYQDEKQKKDKVSLAFGVLE
ncbi:hypothetical protein NFI96_020859 [Prochilodus magdalenae]|nr:hypothetical protein NFI96_020859 [Prochilodus magdalenae]